MVEDKPVHVLILLLSVALMALSQTACHKEPEKTEAQKIVDSFRAKVDGDLQNHKSRKDVWPQTEDQYAEAGWYMEDDELPASYSINVDKTDSLVSPYMGTAEFLVTGSVTYPKNSKDEALAATQFKDSYSINHRLLYAYQNGQWIFKSEKCYYYDITVDGSTWRDCNSDDHGAHLPVMTTP